MSSDDIGRKSMAPERRTFTQGTTIFKEGERADHAYILESGAVEIFKMVSGRRIPLGRVRPWGIFGELGLLDESPRMAAALAVQDAVCMVVSKVAINQMLADAPPGLKVLLDSLVHTVRSAGDDLAQARFQLMEYEKAD